MKLNYGSLALLAIVIGFFLGHSWVPPWTIMRTVGHCILIPSFLLLAIARLQLGQAFSVKAKASMLVTAGIYSRIRNPIYVFGSLAIAGLCLAANHPYWLLSLVVVIPMQVIRSRVEARVLEEKFGEAYVEYKRHTWF
jgi:protein-S-isoprenylcysteine O-methyltransferase Ste14